MIEKLIWSYALKVKQKNINAIQSVEFYNHSLTLIFNFLAVICITLLFGSLLGTSILSSIIAIFSFAALRMVSGGYHFKTLNQCIVYSSLIFICTPLVHYDSKLILWLSLIPLVSVAIYSPSNFVNHSRVSANRYPMLKLLSILIVSANFFIGSEIVLNSFLIQSILIINFGRRESK